MIEYNNIQHIEDLRPLSNLEHLCEIRLEGNPVCRLPFWKYHLMSFCKSLVFINNELVNPEEASRSQFELRILDSLYLGEFAYKMLLWMTNHKTASDSELVKQACRELNETEPQTFNDKIRKQYEAASPDDYFIALRRMCSQKQAEIASLASLLQLNGAGELLSQKIEEAMNFYELAERMHTSSTMNMELLGLGKDDNKSTMLRTEVRNSPRKKGREGLDSIVSRAMTMTMRDFELQKPLTQTDRRKSFMWSTCKSFTDSLITPDTAPCVRIDKLSETIQKQISAKTTICALDETSAVNYHQPFTQKDRPRLVIENSAHSDSEDEEREKQMGLTFDAQMDAELGRSSMYSDSMKSMRYGIDASIMTDTGGDTSSDVSSEFVSEASPPPKAKPKRPPIPRPPSKKSPGKYSERSEHKSDERRGYSLAESGPMFASEGGSPMRFRKMRPIRRKPAKPTSSESESLFPEPITRPLALGMHSTISRLCETADEDF